MTSSTETVAARRAFSVLLSLGAGWLTVSCGDEEADDDPEVQTAQSEPATCPAPVASATPPVSVTPPSAAPALPPGVLRVCERPESAYFDVSTDAWYVSCMAKSDVPDDGYVAKVNAAGTEIITEKFMTGVDEPKGIRIFQGKLYVSDVSALATFDVATGAALATTTIVGIDPRVPDVAVSSLNDVTVDEATGDVYVSDNRNDVLYRFDENGETPQLLFRGPELEGPNGLLMDTRVAGAPRLLFATLGPGLNPQRGVTAKLGAITSIALADLNDGDDQVAVTFISPRIGNLDGIEFVGDDLLVSDFFAGRVMRVTPTGTTPEFNVDDAAIIQQSMARAADLGIDEASGIVAVPETGSGVVTFIDLNAI